VIARAAQNGPGLVLWGPYTALKSGIYRATFSLAASGARPTEQVATIEAVGGPPERVFARKVVTGGDLKPGVRTSVALQFRTPGGYFTETRVYYHGHGTLRAGPVRVVPDPIDRGVRGQFQHWPLAFLWIAGTVLIGWLFVQTMNMRRASDAEATTNDD